MNMGNKYEVTDRYDGLMPRPDPETMCDGPCEGMGVYPHKCSDNINHRLRADKQDCQAWDEAHNAPDAHDSRFDNGECDGYHFIKCRQCNGTGKRINKGETDK